MKKKIKLLLATILLSTNVFADWVLISASDNGSSTYYDPASMTRQGGLVKSWSLIDFQSVQKEEGDSYLSSIGMWDIDCNRNVLRQTYHAIYPGHMGVGKTIWAGTISKNFQPAMPFSNGDRLLKFACDKR